MSDKHKHLEFLQSAVNRMASNLFFLKGWAISLIAALFALAAKDSNQNFVLVAMLPVAIFWLLDGYFLAQERRFRDLYDHVRKTDEANIDYSMDTTPFSGERRNTVLGAMVSKTLLAYYGTILVLLITYFVYFYFRHTT